MPEINPSQLIAHQIRVLKNVEKFLRKQENLECVLSILNRQPNARVEETGREQSRPNAWDIGLKAAVVKSLPLVRGDFIYRGVEAVMLQHGFQFQTADRRNAISGVLRELVTEGILIEVRKGMAGKPTIFRYAVTQ
jgi:hypothetical protein